MDVPPRLAVPPGTEAVLPEGLLSPHSCSLPTAGAELLVMRCPVSVWCQKGLSSGTASLESLGQPSSLHSSEHTYATLSQLSSSRVKHTPPAVHPCTPLFPKRSPPGALPTSEGAGRSRAGMCMGHVAIGTRGIIHRLLGDTPCSVPRFPLL